MSAITKSPHYLVVSFFILFSVGISYQNTLRNDFVLDDHSFITTNAYIKDLGNLTQFFTNKYSLSSGGHGIYRPLRTLSFALDYKFGKLEPRGYHLTNIFLHALNGILVYVLLISLTKDFLLSLFAALFFILHPIQTEAVAVVAHRGELLYSLFFISGLIAYIKNKNYFSEGMYFLALLSKETAIVFPLILFIYDVSFRSNSIKPQKYIPYVLITIFYLLIRFVVLGSLAEREFWGGGSYYSMLTEIKVIAYYLKLLLFPFRLQTTYNVTMVKSFFELEVIIAASVLIMLFYLAWVCWQKKFGIGLFFITWYFILLAPVANINPQKCFMGERFLYIASLSFYIALARFFIWIFKNLPKALGYSLLILLVLFYSGRTILRNRDWKDEFTVWTKIIQQTQTLSLKFNFKKDRGNQKVSARNPNLAIPHNNMGVLYFQRGKVNIAIREFQEAIRIKPDYAQAHYNLALSYLATSPPNLELAKRHFDLAKSLGYEGDKGQTKER